MRDFRTHTYALCVSRIQENYTLRFPLGLSWLIEERRARKERAGRRKRWLSESLYLVQLHASLTFGHCIGVDHRGARKEIFKLKHVPICISI